MNRISCARHRFSSVVIQHAVWLCFRFALSYRDAKDLLVVRGIDASYGTVRRLVPKFGHADASWIRLRRLPPSRQLLIGCATPTSSADRTFLHLRHPVHNLPRL